MEIGTAREKRNSPKSALSELQEKSDSKSLPWFFWPQEAFEKFSLEIPCEKFRQNRSERACTLVTVLAAPE